MDPQSLDSVQDALDRALTLTNGTPVYLLSAQERAAIDAVYQLYELVGGQPHDSLRPTALDAARTSLYAAYDQVQMGGRLAALRSDILASTDACPYCGFGEPKDIDHYIPRSVYGELAIYPSNLIPSCGPCNNAKRAIVPGLGDERSLIHPYFQTLPDLDFLKADIGFAGGVLDVNFRIDPACVSNGLAKKLQFQLDRLKLNQRYTAQINKFVSEQRTAILMLHDYGAEIVSIYLHRNAASLAASFHRNDWRASLMRALAEVPEFCADPAAYLGEDAVTA